MSAPASRPLVANLCLRDSRLAELIRRLETVPFEPFTIHMTDGVKHYVPTSDHISITKKLRQVCYETDEPRIYDINPVHIVRIERGKRRHKKAA